MMVRSYKGYEGVVTFIDTDANLITGEIVNIQDAVNFQARTPAELQQAFRESVDEYLTGCEARGVDPGRPFSGQLNVRLKDMVARETSSLPSIAREAGAFTARPAPSPVAHIIKPARKAAAQHESTKAIARRGLPKAKEDDRP
jgi:predicted HicB family RNase H-like nuclease